MSGTGQTSDLWRRGVVAMVVAAMSALAGCSGAPAGLMRVTSLPADGADPVEMLVVTTRSAAPDAAEAFDGERAGRATYRRIVVSVPNGTARHVGTIQWPEGGRADPSRHFAVVEHNAESGDSAHAWLAGRASRRVLVFVHGFRMDFGPAVYRFAQVVHDSRTDFTPVMFSWPSRGSILGYYYDRESMDGSRDDLERLLRRLAEDPKVDEVAVLAHSMGGWVTMEAVRTMAVYRAGMPTKLRKVILTSPDLDFHVFGAQLDRIGSTPKVTLVVARDDRMLEFSRLFGGMIDRLGAIAPDDRRYRHTLCEHGVTIVDASHLDTQGAARHYKFADSPQLLKLLERILAERDLGRVDVSRATGGAARAVSLACDGRATETSAGEGAPIVVYETAARSLPKALGVARR
jgi:esterase/lipase superfamily enzyme